MKVIREYKCNFTDDKGIGLTDEGKKLIEMGGFLREYTLSQYVSDLPSWAIETMIKLTGDNPYFLIYIDEINKINKNVRKIYKNLIGERVRLKTGGFIVKPESAEMTEFYKWYLNLTMELLYGKRSDEYQDIRNFLEEYGWYDDPDLYKFKSLYPVDLMIATAGFGFNGFISSETDKMAEELGCKEKFTQVIWDRVESLIDDSPDPEEHDALISTFEYLAYKRQANNKDI